MSVVYRIVNILQGQVQAKIRGKYDVEINLGSKIAEYVTSREDYSTNSCVLVSYYNFFKVCTEKIGCGKKLIFEGDGGTIAPLIANSSGSVINMRNFYYIWISRNDLQFWEQLPEKCRGAGAPGALLYADLVDGRKFLVSSTGWPEGLKKGAFLQMWKNKNVYERVKAGEKLDGHSLIFIRYSNEDDSIIISDQKQEKKVTYPYHGLKYVIGANLKNVELING